MCTLHRRAYTNALRQAALPRKAADGEVSTQMAPTEPEPIEAPEPVGTRGKRATKAVVPAAGSCGDAG